MAAWRAVLHLPDLKTPVEIRPSSSEHILHDISERVTLAVLPEQGRDDHEMVRQGVRAFLDARAEFTVVGEAETGTGAVRQDVALVL